MNKIKIKNIEGLVRDWEKWKLTRDGGVWQRLWEYSERIKGVTNLHGCAAIAIDTLEGAPPEWDITDSKLCRNVRCSVCPFSAYNSKIENN